MLFVSLYDELADLAHDVHVTSPNKLASGPLQKLHKRIRHLSSSIIRNTHRLALDMVH